MTWAWTDGTPLVVFDWYTHNTERAGSEFAIFENGNSAYSSKYIEKYDMLNETLSNTLNCTAMISTSSGYPGPWIRIPCDANFTSSFFCSTEPTINKNNTPPFNWYADWSTQSDTGESGVTIREQVNASSAIKCPANNILIRQSCLMFSISGKLTTHSAFRDFCSEHGASSLTINDTQFKKGKLSSYYHYSQLDLTYVPLDLKEGIDAHFRDALDFSSMYSYSNSFLPDDVMYFFQEKKPKLWFYESENTHGHPLFVYNSDKTMSYVLKFISLEFSDYFFNVSLPILPLFVDDGTCLLLHPDHLKKMPVFSAHDGFSARGWRLQQVNCSQHHAMSVLVCVAKPSYTYFSNCPDNYSHCQDGSCVLSVYVCDGHQDCDSDEQHTGCDLLIGQVTLDCPNSEFWSVNNSVISSHSICDGVNQCDTGEDETGCHKDQIYKARLPFNVDNTFDTTMNIAGNNGIIPFNKSIDVLSVSLCTYTKNVMDVSFDYNLLLNCKHVLCPGMFKCRQSYCIDIVAICDGIIDCPGSEDESMCLDLHCPAMIKCRAETKCVPTWKVCDGVFDCTLNKDDEAACYTCPNSCSCHSYYMECKGDDDMYWQLQNIQNIYVKTITLSIKNVLFYFAALAKLYDLVYIDISGNDVKKIILSSTYISQYRIKLLLFNCSFNSLMYVNLKNEKFFNFVQVIDLSNNKLTKFTDIPASVKIVYLKYNFITFLFKLKNTPNMRFLDVQNNPIKIIYLTDIQNLPSLVYVKSPTISFCCILPPNVHCSYIRASCRGLRSFYTLRVLTLSLAVFISLASLVQMIRYISVLYTSPHKNYSLLVIHISLSDIILCIWVILSCSLYSNQSLYQWHFSDMCNVLGVVSFTSLQMSLYAQLYEQVFLYFKIVHPLRKQKRWIDNTKIISFLLWLFSIMTSVSVHVNLGQVYIHGDLCIILSAQGKIIQWIALFYCSMCYVFLVVVAFSAISMYIAIINSLQILQLTNVIKNRRLSARRIFLSTLIKCSWWTVFGTLIFVKNTTEMLSALQQDSVFVGAIIHIMFSYKTVGLIVFLYKITAKKFSCVISR